MRSEELLIILLVGGVLIVVPLIAIILSIIAIVKIRRIAELSRRVAYMESYLRRISTETLAGGCSTGRAVLGSRICEYFFPPDTKKLR